MPISIRDAEMTDLDDLQRVFRSASLSNEDDRGLLLEHPEWLVLAGEGIVDGRVRVAIDAVGAVIGFATVQVLDGVAELEDLFVDPRWMRQGVGAALVEDAAARLRLHDHEFLEVTANPHAMAFYERAGFVAQRVVDTEGYPALRMTRSTRPLG